MESAHYRLDGGQATITLERRIVPASARVSDEEDLERQLLHAALLRLPAEGGEVVVRFWFGPSTSEGARCEKLAQSAARRLQALGCTILIATSWWRDGSCWEQGGVLSFQASAMVAPLVKNGIEEPARFDPAEAELVSDDADGCPDDALELLVDPRHAVFFEVGRAPDIDRAPLSTDRVKVRLRGDLARGFQLAVRRSGFILGPELAEESYRGWPWLLAQLGADHPVSERLDRNGWSGR